MAMWRPSPSSAALRARFSTTTPGWPWPASWGWDTPAHPVFSELQSHYLFADRFGRHGKGNDKGKVEGLIGYSRRNFLVPIPRFESFAARNAHLERRCRERQAAKLRGHEKTIAARLVRDRAAFLPLPAAAYDACDKRPGRVSPLPLVRDRGHDSSVPVAYGHREVLVRSVELVAGKELVGTCRLRWWTYN